MSRTLPAFLVGVLCFLQIIFAGHGLIPKNYSLKGLFYDPLQAELERKETLRKIYLTAIAISAAVFAILVLFVFFLRKSVKSKTRELYQSETKLKSVLETLPLGIWFTDEKGKIVYGNPAGLEIWQGASYVEPDRFHEYKAWWRDTGEPISPDEWGITRAIRNKETSREEEIEIECFDGTHKVILNWSAPILDINGRISGAVAINQDISNRVALGEEIKLLRGILPICSICKNIRNDEGYYEQIESYFHKYSGVNFSHTICPHCMQEHYPKEYESIIEKKNLTDK
jgi:PAS domain-containing protein